MLFSTAPAAWAQYQTLQDRLEGRTRPPRAPYDPTQENKTRRICGGDFGLRNKPPRQLTPEELRQDREYAKAFEERARERNERLIRILADRQEKKERTYANYSAEQQRSREEMINYGINQSLHSKQVYTIESALKYADLGDLKRCTGQNAQATPAYDNSLKILKHLNTPEALELYNQVSRRRMKAQ